MEEKFSMTTGLDLSPMSMEVMGTVPAAIVTALLLQAMLIQAMLIQVMLILDQVTIKVTATTQMDTIQTTIMVIRELLTTKHTALVLEM